MSEPPIRRVLFDESDGGIVKHAATTASKEPFEMLLSPMPRSILKDVAEFSSPPLPMQASLPTLTYQSSPSDFVATFGRLALSEPIPPPMPPLVFALAEDVSMERQGGSHAHTAPGFADFEVLKQISNGAFGIVHLVRRRGDAGAHYAMKIMK